MKLALSSRPVFLAGFIGICLLLVVAAYLQTVDGITPCALCLFQRFVLAVLGGLFFLGAVFKFKRIALFILGLLATLTSVAGIILAGRQVWLQYFTSSLNGNCTASLEYMLQVMPITEVIKKVFIGGTECSRVDWQFLHLSLAEWSLVCFVGLFFLSFYQIVISFRRH